MSNSRDSRDFGDCRDSREFPECGKRRPKRIPTVFERLRDFRDLQFLNEVVLNAVGRRKSAKERKRKSAKERKSAQKRAST